MITPIPKDLSLGLMRYVFRKISQTRVYSRFAPASFLTRGAPDCTWLGLRRTPLPTVSAFMKLHRAIMRQHEPDWRKRRFRLNPGWEILRATETFRERRVASELPTIDELADSSSQRVFYGDLSEIRDGLRSAAAVRCNRMRRRLDDILWGNSM